MFNGDKRLAEKKAKYDLNFLEYEAIIVPNFSVERIKSDYNEDRGANLLNSKRLLME